MKGILSEDIDVNVIAEAAAINIFGNENDRIHDRGNYYNGFVDGWKRRANTTPAEAKPNAIEQKAKSWLEKWKKRRPGCAEYLTGCYEGYKAALENNHSITAEQLVADKDAEIERLKGLIRMIRFGKCECDECKAGWELLKQQHNL